MKYLFLDFGYVICYPTTGEWFITPYLNQFLKERNIDKKELLKNVKYFGGLLDMQLLTLEEEKEMFYEFYKGLFEMTYHNVNCDELMKIADDFTYSTDKYRLFKDIRDELIQLKDMYHLILFSDNWPCGEYLMHQWDLSKYFEDMYISSYYGIKKDNEDFFKIPMNDHGIDPSQVLFVDDSNYPLNTAMGLGIESYKMDRYNNISSDDYEVIHDLKCLCR